MLHDGTLYLCTPFNRVFALDAETGAERWVFDPGARPRAACATSTAAASRSTRTPPRPPDAACRVRVLTGTMDLRLIALDAATGERCAGFGADGEVDLRARPRRRRARAR